MTDREMREMGTLNAIVAALKDRLEDLKEQARRDLIELNKAHNVDRLNVVINDEVVGHMTLPKPKKRTVLEVNDRKALFADGLYDMAQFVKDNAELYAQWCFETTGSLPDGCEMVEYTEPAYLNTPRLTGCRPKDVFPALDLPENVDMPKLLMEAVEPKRLPEGGDNE